jgi:hypothetical protein
MGEKQTDNKFNVRVISAKISVGKKDFIIIKPNKVVSNLWAYKKELKAEYDSDDIDFTYMEKD